MKAFESRLRLTTGIILSIYVIQHLINHSLGIVSFELAESYRQTVGHLFQTLLGQVLLYGSVSVHLIIALKTIYLRSSLHMSRWQWIQMLMGLSIIPLVAGHAIGNRAYHLIGNIDPDYYYVVTSLLLKPIILVKLSVLILVIWLHLVIGLHFWLRLKRGYSGFVPALYAVVILIPALAAVGVINMLKEASLWLDDEQRLDQIYAPVRAMDRSDLEFLSGLENWILSFYVVLLIVVLIARWIRLWLARRRGSYTVTCPDGKTFTELHDITLLDAFRNARIPHASVCGGKARCTTCRVRVGTGLTDLPAPNDLEALALKRISASPDIRLACQIKPTSDLSITPLVMANQPLNTALHAGGVHGHEEYVVAMFVDMRGSTSLGERILAYDVVFILNRFFTELSEALSDSHGHYAQFAGDGLMALYGLDPGRKDRACADALEGAREMFRRIKRLNEQLSQEFSETIEMGIGIHGGEAIVGTMGPPKTPLLTAVGDNINIAARLEAQTKTLGFQLLVSAETLGKESIAYVESETREVDVRGRLNQVKICCYSPDQIPVPSS